MSSILYTLIMQYYETQDKHALARLGVSYRAWLNSQFSNPTDTPLDLIPTSDEPIGARLEHGRWIVECPKCNDPQLMSSTMRFLCVCCENSVWHKVSIPDKDAIETLLSLIPVSFQDWNGESIEQLTELIERVKV